MATVSQQKPCVTSNSNSGYFATYSGTYTYNFSSVLPSNAIITSVTFTADTHYLQTQINANYHIALMSDSSDTEGTQITDSLNFVHNSTSTKKSIVGTVWTVNSSYYSNFFNSNIILRIVNTSVTSGTRRIHYGSNESYLDNTNKGLLTCTITYIEPSVTAPSNLTLYQLTSGQYYLTWNRSTGSNGSGDVTYTVWSVSNVEPIADVGTNTYYLANIPGYDYYYEYRVVASYSGVDATSSTVGSYFQPPSIIAPTFSLTPELGDSTTLSWDKPTINYGTATYYDYTIHYSTSYSSDIEYYTLSNRDDANISLAVLSSWLDSVVSDGEIILFTLTATAHIDSYVADSSYETLAITTEAIMFTYDGKNTIAYYNGSNWELCTVHYYTGSEWKECIPYYYDGTTWQEIKTKL